MRELSLQLYHSMHQDIEICKNKGFDEEKEIECCSQISKKYWQQLQKKLVVHHFNDDEEEIDFFKNIKPLFTSEIEYYNLMLHAQLFRPPHGKEALERFWWREMLRLEEFTQANPQFYDYHQSGKTVFDKFFYLRRCNDVPNFPDPLITELEKKTSALNDNILAEYIALKKYTQYVQKQIEKLNNTTDGN